MPELREFICKMLVHSFRCLGWMTNAGFQKCDLGTRHARQPTLILRQVKVRSALRVACTLAGYATMETESFTPSAGITFSAVPGSGFTLYLS